MAKSIIFDMDGTMIDNMMVHHRAWQRKLKELGMEMSLEEVHQKVHGVNVEILERLFPEKYSLEERERISAEKEAEYRKIFEPELQLVPGLEKLLITLTEAGIPLGIGSAAPPENVDFVMDNLGLRHYFKTVKHAEDVENGKPHPEIYLKVAEAMGVMPGDCLVFEDTPAGATAAERAGCDIILVTTTHQPEEFTSNTRIIKYISDFTEIDGQELLAEFKPD